MIHNGFVDIGYQTNRHVSAIEFVKSINNIVCTHALGIQTQNLIIHTGDTGLSFGHHFKLKRGTPISSRGERNFAMITFQGFSGIAVGTVAAIAALRLIMTSLAKMIVHLSI